MKARNIIDNLQEIESEYQVLIAKENLSEWDFSFEDYKANLYDDYN